MDALEIRANFFSIGGAILLMICVMLTVIAFMAVSADFLTAQSFIAVLVAGGAWIYYARSVTERLRFQDTDMTYTSCLAQGRRISLHDLDTLRLTHQGFNLERGMETMTIERRDGTSDSIALGPCWQRHQLETFLASVQTAMRESRVLKKMTYV